MALLVVLVSALFAAALAPVTRRLALWLGAEDIPGDPRKIHARRVPRLGGLALAAGVAAGTAVAAWTGRPAPGEGQGPSLAFLAGAALVTVALGLVDDVRNLGPRLKLAGGAVAALLAAWGGWRIDLLDLAGAELPLGAWAVPLTVAWYLAAMNAFNLVDGVDGLAASLGLVAAAALLAVGAGAGTGLVLALAGALAGVLAFNAHPARQFIGSCGSLLAGLLLAALLAARGPLHPVLPALVLGIPLLDTLLAVLRRLARGTSPFAPDRQHLHHRLLDRGFGHWGTVLVLALSQALLAAAAVAGEAAGGAWRWAPLVPAAALAVGLSGWLGYGALLRPRRAGPLPEGTR